MDIVSSLQPPYSDEGEYEEDQNDDFYDNNSGEGELNGVQIFDSVSLFLSSFTDTDEASECELDSASRNYDETIEMKEQ